MKDEAIVGFISGLAGAFIELCRELEASGNLSRQNVIARLKTLQNCAPSPNKQYADTISNLLVAAIENDDPHFLAKLLKH